MLICQRPPTPSKRVLVPVLLATRSASMTPPTMTTRRLRIPRIVILHDDCPDHGMGRGRDGQAVSGKLRGQLFNPQLTLGKPSVHKHFDDELTSFVQRCRDNVLNTHDRKPDHGP